MFCDREDPEMCNTLTLNWSELLHRLSTVYSGMIIWGTMSA